MSNLDKCFFHNLDKLGRAKMAVKAKGALSVKEAIRSGRSENTLYHRAVQELKDATEEDLILYIYKGLGGKVDEYSTPAKAEEAKKEAEAKVVAKKDKKKK